MCKVIRGIWWIIYLPNLLPSWIEAGGFDPTNQIIVLLKVFCVLAKFKWIFSYRKLVFLRVGRKIGCEFQIHRNEKIWQNHLCIAIDIKRRFSLISRWTLASGHGMQHSCSQKSSVLHFHHKASGSWHS